MTSDQIPNAVSDIPSTASPVVSVAPTSDQARNTAGTDRPVVARVTPLSALAVLVFCIGLMVTLLVILIGPHEGDPLPFLPIAERAASHHVAYRDFSIEYPPLGFVFIALPRLLGGSAHDAYQTLFSLLSLVFAAGTAAGAWCLARWRWSASSVRDTMLILLGLGLSISPLIVWRFDILSAFLCTIALVAYAARHHGWAGLMIGFGALSKIYPALLAPILIVAQLFERQWRSAALIVVGVAVAGLSVMLEVWLAAGSGAFSFLAYQQNRLVEIESMSGGLALLASAFGGPVAHVALGFGSWQVTSPIIGDLRLPMTALNALVATAFVVAWLYSFARDVRESGKVRPLTIVQYSLALIMVAILTNKVLSPQYLVWLLPFAALQPRRQSLLVLAIFVLTTIEYPLTFQALVQVNPAATVLVNVRNLLLLIYFAWIVWPRGTGQCASERRYVGDPAH